MSSAGKRKPVVLVLEATERVGGGQRVTLDMMGALRDSFEFAGVAPRQGPLAAEYEKLRIPSYVVGYPSPRWKFGWADRITYLPRGLLATRGVARLVREVNADLIYCTSRTGAWAALAGRWTKTPVVMHLHLVPANARTGRFLRWVAARRAVKRVVLASPAIDVPVAVPSQKLTVVPNGVDARKFTVDAALREEARSQFAAPAERFLVGVVGELAPDKGQDDAIRAVAYLRRRGHDAGLLIAGTARDGNDAYADFLRSLARELNIEDRVIFAGHREDVKSVYAALDALAVPSKGQSGEACPLVALEAWAAGTPVVAANSGGLPDLMSAGRGRLFEAGNPGALADELQRLIDRPDERGRLREAGLQAVASDYSLRTFADRMATVFNESLSAPF